MAARSTRYAEFPRTTTATPFPTSAFYGIGLGLVPMVAVAPLFLAECQRRGAPSSRDRGFFQGGSYLVLLRPLRPGTRLLWLAAALALWGILLAFPVWFAVWHGWFDDARDEFWMLRVLSGFVAAGFAGTILGSILKAVSNSGSPSSPPAPSARCRPLLVCGEVPRRRHLRVRPWHRPGLADGGALGPRRLGGALSRRHPQLVAKRQVARQSWVGVVAGGGGRDR